MCLSSPKSKQREKQRKLLPGEVPPAAAIEQTPEELKKSKLLLEEMSGLADQFVSNGELDIYQETYERLKSKLNRLQSSTSSTTANSAFDMYGDTDISSSINASKLSTESTGRIQLFARGNTTKSFFSSFINHSLGIHDRRKRTWQTPRSIHNRTDDSFNQHGRQIRQRHCPLPTHWNAAVLFH